jgi:hypothetical protein
MMRTVFGLDPRSLAVGRILIGFILLLDAAFRANNLRAHYTDWGVLPRGALITDFLSPWIVSVHLVSGTAWATAALFLLGAVAALCMMAGYRTTLATFVCWFLSVSVQARNPLVTDGGDLALRQLLFWCIFLPLGRVWAVDAWGRERRAPDAVFSAASIALVCQLAFIYIFAALLKSGPQWRTDFTAVHYALHLDEFATSFGVWLRQFETVTKGLTAMTVVLEGVIPWFLFVPWGNGPIRTSIVTIFASLHLGFAISLDLGIFPFIMIAGWLSLLPPWFWEKAQQRYAALRLHNTTSAPEQRSFREPAQIVCLICLAYAFAWNVRELDVNRWSRWFPARFNLIGFTLRLDQKWTMFAPHPPLETGWYVIPAKLRGGGEVDLFKGAGPVFYDKPEDVAATYLDQRWRKYWMNLHAKDHSAYRIHYGRYLCRSWNEQHSGPDVLESLEIVFVREFTPPPGHPKRSPDRILLWNHKCF